MQIKIKKIEKLVSKNGKPWAKITDEAGNTFSCWLPIITDTLKEEGMFDITFSTEGMWKNIKTSKQITEITEKPVVIKNERNESIERQVMYKISSEITQKLIETNKVKLDELMGSVLTDTLASIVADLAESLFKKFKGVQE